MTEAIFHLPAPTSGWRRLSARLAQAFGRTILARATRRALNGLPDETLRDIGVARSEIDFIASTVAARRGDPSREARHPLNIASTEPAMTAGAPCARARACGSACSARPALAAVLAAVVILVSAGVTFAQDAQVKRGQYLVTLGGCNDCHTPGYFFGKPEMARLLGGSEVGFEIPGLGVFHGPNLTPDAETGLGRWSREEIAKAITTGVRPDGRVLAPIMPWHAFANLTREDVGAIVAFLKSCRR